MRDPEESKKRPLRVLLYTRVSTPRQAQKGYSLEEQLHDLRDHAKSQGSQVVGEITDPGKSGRSADREGFQALMKAVRQLKPDAVLVTKVSRFMRNARLTHRAVAEMLDLGVHLICVDEVIDTRNGLIAELTLSILAHMAEWESERQSEYSRRTRAELISRGKWPGGKPPYGYRNDKELGKLVIDEDQAKVVRRIYDRYARNRVGMRQIALELGDEPTPGGSQFWFSSTISLILSDPVYVGRQKLGATVETPIIDEETFNQAQKRRRSNKSFHPRREMRWPLQGRFKCATCGSSIGTSTTRHPYGTYRYYVCPGRTKHHPYRRDKGRNPDGVPCSTESTRADRLELALWEQIVRTISDPEEFVTVLESAIATLKSQATELSRDAEPLQEKLKEIDAELKRLDWAYVKGRIPAAELDVEEKKLIKQRDVLQTRFEALDPDRVEELELARARLRVAEEYLEGVRETGSGDPNEFSKPKVLYLNGDSEVREKATKSSRMVDLIPIPEDPEERRAQFVADWLLIPGWRDAAPKEEETKISWLLTKALDRLQAEVWVFEDHLELRGALQLDKLPALQSLLDKESKFPQASSSGLIDGRVINGYFSSHFQY